MTNTDLHERVRKGHGGGAGHAVRGCGGPHTEGGGSRGPGEGPGNLNQAQRRYQLAGSREGAEQVNTFCLSLSKVKVGGFYPSQEQIDFFLSNTLSLDAKKILSVLNMRAKKCINISFIRG